MSHVQFESPGFGDFEVEKENTNSSLMDPPQHPFSGTNIFHQKMVDTQSMVTRLANEIIALRGETKRLKDDLACQTDEAKISRRKMQEAEDKNHRLERELENLRITAVRELETTMHRLQMESQRKEEEQRTTILDLERQLELMTSKYQHANTERDTSQEALTAYQKEMAIKLDTLSSSKQDDRQIVLERIKLRSENDSLKEEMKSVNLELHQERGKIRALEIEIRKLLDDHREIKTAKELEVQIADLRHDKESQVLYMETIKRECERYQLELRESMQREGRLVVELESAKKDMVETKEAVKLEGRVEEAEKIIEEKNKELHVERKKYIRLKDLYAEAKEDAQQYEIMMNNVINDNKRLEIELAHAGNNSSDSSSDSD